MVYPGRIRYHPPKERLPHTETQTGNKKELSRKDNASDILKTPLSPGLKEHIPGWGLGWGDPWRSLRNQEHGNIMYPAMPILV